MNRKQITFSDSSRPLCFETKGSFILWTHFCFTHKVLHLLIPKVLSTCIYCVSLSTHISSGIFKEGLIRVPSFPCTWLLRKTVDLNGQDWTYSLGIRPRHLLIHPIGAQPFTRLPTTVSYLCTYVIFSLCVWAGLVTSLWTEYNQNYIMSFCY